MAATGHGKTRMLEHLIVKDVREEKTVIVIDSQGQLIPRLLRANLCPADRVLLIDPRDVDAPLAFNLFDIGRVRANQYSRRMKEQIENSTIELIQFILASLLDAELTARQATPFRYAIRLMYHIPNSNMRTFASIFRKGADEYEEYFQNLSPFAQDFFTDKDYGFDGKEYAPARKEIMRRIYGLMDNPTFERMFTAPDTRLNMLAEMEAGKLILINTAKAFLQPSVSTIFGRFFLALIQQASMERAEQRNPRPTYVYIDECHEYLDDTCQTLIDQARKSEIGLVLAHQRLDQVKKFHSALMSCGTRFYGGTQPDDARYLAGQLQCSMSQITDQPKGRFVMKVRTDPAMPIQFPGNTLDLIPFRDRKDIEDILMRTRRGHSVLGASAQPVSDDEPKHRGPRASRPKPETISKLLAYDKGAQWDTW